MGERIDSWLHGGSITRTSLARYRVLYALVVLLLLPDFSWITFLPDSMYHPPPGPMALFSGFPSELTLRLLETALAVCLVAILIGWWTRTASFLAVGVAMLGYGFTYGVGKIDHDILLVLVPAAMAVAGWGDRMSVDAVRRRARGDAEPSELAAQWPLRLYALAIGLAFATAALPKIRGGWLDPTTHAVQAIQVRQYFTHRRDDLLAHTFLGIENPVFWELIDIATIMLEAGMVIAVLTWAGTRFGFAVASTFHLGVWLMMNIPFVMNVVTYGFVVPWDRVPTPRALSLPAPRSSRLLRAAPVVVVGGGVAWSLAVEELGNAAPVMNPVVLVTGGVIGGTYLVLLAVRAVRVLGSRGQVRQLIHSADDAARRHAGQGVSETRELASSRSSVDAPAGRLAERTDGEHPPA